MSTSIDPGPVTVSVCIPTFHRPALLARCLESLASQTLPAFEIVISNAGTDQETPRVITEFSARYKHGKVIHCPTDRRALPWQRWWAFTHSKGAIVLFIDDDIDLTPDALRSLIEVYQREQFNLAGAGFLAATKGKGPAARRRGSARERWLRIETFADGSITPGGQAVSWNGTAGMEDWQEVERLSGGGMSYPREILIKLGPLEHLYELYDQRLGKGEDAVLSALAGRYGKLVVLTGPLTYHPDESEAPTTAFPRNGFRRGMVGTWGIANTMRWLATDFDAYRRSWTRAALLELFRSTSAALRQPFAQVHWYQLCGALTGIAKTLWHWGDIPLQPSRSHRKTGSLFDVTRHFSGFFFLLSSVPDLFGQVSTACEWLL